MRLKLLLPSHVLIDEPVQKVIAQGGNGSFCLEPRHVDFVSELAPGLLQFVDADGQEVFVAVDEGVLVKCADEVMISAYNAVRGEDLETLKDTVEHRFRQLNEGERIARSALSRLEAGVVRRFTQMQEGR
ncbi:F0F1 ATP synthase subunit epsilon [Methylomarinum sp. Ch1-1]|uniref:ATP synthase epsilon chain n=1 Tax=Methylomarinum roseum TaxID=3067653 RepID=A0AAU7NWT9_9GAMM|nr:F0F1 ATP synthase subunit epsilon [Methylomarinum sp. Ch1-1]MDP4522406.1 F0F1 ATP synthase subunit epsilon [Methylomarinum sp. Ch1-1]